MELDLQSVLIKVYSFALYFFYHREKDIKLVLQFIDFTGRVTKCYQWLRRLIALSFRPSQILSFGLNLKFIHSGPGTSIMC